MNLFSSLYSYVIEAALLKRQDIITKTLTRLIVTICRYLRLNDKARSLSTLIVVWIETPQNATATALKMISK